MSAGERFTFEPTTDYEWIRRVVTNPKLWRMQCDDFAPAPEEYEPPKDPKLLYLLGREGRCPVGFWLFIPQNAICWEMHTCLLPHSWGRETGLPAAIAMLAWLWRNTPCQRLVTSVPSFNRLALQFGKRMGLAVYGTNERSYQKDGILHDQILLGVSRPGN